MAEGLQVQDFVRTTVQVQGEPGQLNETLCQHI